MFTIKFICVLLHGRMLGRISMYLGNHDISLYAQARGTEGLKAHSEANAIKGMTKRR